jgi:MerR family transcriptional regulator, thiopeptide resistance regulator
MAAGDGPDSISAMDVAERHRRHIGRWFYDRSYEVHRGFADM